MRPILIELFGLPIYSYPLLMGIGWGVGFNITQAHWSKRGYNEFNLKLLFVGSFILAWIGAKIFFLLFSSPDKISIYSKAASFWLGGGFVFYGGLIFSSLYVLVLCLSRKDIKLTQLALLTPGLCIGHAIGRLGCFLAGCCYGNICDLPIGVRFHEHLRHPVQLYEALGLVSLFYMCHQFIKESKDMAAVYSYFIGYSVLRFLLEFFRGDEIRGHFFNLSTSQWVSVVIVIILILCVVASRFLKNHEEF